MDKKRIHDELFRLLRQGPYYVCTVDHETGQMTIDTTSPVSPIGIAVNEVASAFSQSKYSPALATDKVEWEWQGRVDFPSTSISFEEMEAALTATVIKIPGTAGQRSLLVSLQGVRYTHPPESSPNGGSLAVFTFQVLPQSMRK